MDQEVREIQFPKGKLHLGEESESNIPPPNFPHLLLLPVNMSKSPPTYKHIQNILISLELLQITHLPLVARILVYMACSTS